MARSKRKLHKPKSKKSIDRSLRIIANNHKILKKLHNELN